MATASGRALCSTCNKEKPTFTCEGCSQRFCKAHLREHQQILERQLEEIINEHDQFRQAIVEHNQQPRNSSVIERIDQWEQTSIAMIRRRAEECRQMVHYEKRRIVQQVEVKLAPFTDQLRHVKEENEYNEFDLQRLNKQLTEFREELIKCSNVAFEEDPQALIKNVHISISMSGERQAVKLHLSEKHATTVAGGCGSGSEVNQLICPFGICVDQNNALLVADYNNHRIVRCGLKTNSTIAVVAGNGQGNRIDQLNSPTDVIVDKRDHSIIIADHQNKRVVRWFIENEQTKAKILIDQISCRGLAMDAEGNLYVADNQNNRIQKFDLLSSSK